MWYHSNVILGVYIIFPMLKHLTEIYWKIYNNNNNRKNLSYLLTWCNSVGLRNNNGSVYGSVDRDWLSSSFCDSFCGALCGSIGGSLGGTIRKDVTYSNW